MEFNITLGFADDLIVGPFVYAVVNGDADSHYMGRDAGEAVEGALDDYCERHGIEWLS